MLARLSIVAGLVVGVAVAGLALGGIFALTPESLPAAVPSPTAGIATASPAAVSSLPPTPSPSPSPSATDGPFHVGRPAPPLVVPQVGGGTIDLASLRGKPVWVNFMATWCPPCQDEFPLMNSFAARYEETGLVVLAIDVQEDEPAVAAFAESLGAVFPMGLDGDGEASREWGAVALPVHFWNDTEGIVRDGALGGIGPDVMADGLRSILPGVDVTP
ncbi:MAG: TlpA family protein disulfide reductase [Thermomicrobiales bacterium]|nr:MAG: TlpA family protein disulfide reductase [Thermomicrobiales bacterium]